MKLIVTVFATTLAALVLSACSGSTTAPSIDTAASPSAGMPAANDYMYRSPSAAIMRNPGAMSGAAAGRR